LPERATENVNLAILIATPHHVKGLEMAERIASAFPRLIGDPE
jgi:hypothetical protein